MGDSNGQRVPGYLTFEFHNRCMKGLLNIHPFSNLFAGEPFLRQLLIVMMKDYEMPVIFFPNEPSADRLGNPELDTQRYLWQKVKLPQGKSWSKDAKFFKDKSYDASTIYFFDNAPDLYVRFVFKRGRRCEYVYSKEFKRTVCAIFKQSALYLTIKNYAELTALEVLNDLYKGCSSLSL